MNALKFITSTTEAKNACSAIGKDGERCRAPVPFGSPQRICSEHAKIEEKKAQKKKRVSKTK
jgi:hypothetical protein